MLITTESFLKFKMNHYANRILTSTNPKELDFLTEQLFGYGLQLIELREKREAKKEAVMAKYGFSLN